jgi:hypothetical protein
MNELKVSQQAGIISTNLDAIKEEITQQMAQYKDYTVTEDSVKDDKKVLADLRKLEKSLDDSRKSVKKLWMQPYEEFEGRCKEVIALVEEPINLINGQIKLFEEDAKNVKLEYVKGIYEREIGEYQEYLPFDKVFNQKWLNKSYTDGDIVYDLSQMRLKVKTDLEAIHALGSEVEQECIKAYINSDNNLSVAIQRNAQYMADKEKIETDTVKEASTKEPVKVGTAKIIVSVDDLPQIKETLDFMGVKYQVEGE